MVSKAEPWPKIRVYSRKFAVKIYVNLRNLPGVSAIELRTKNYNHIKIKHLNHLSPHCPMPAVSLPNYPHRSHLLMCESLRDFGGSTNVRLWSSVFVAPEGHVHQYSVLRLACTEHQTHTLSNH